MGKKYFPALKLRGESYKIAESREPGERIRTIGIVQIDRTVFKKSKQEKEILKLAKLQSKIDEMKR
jgi:hypothetical protein